MTATNPVSTQQTTHGGPAKGFGGHPRGLSTLFLTEMWERFSYYGLRPLLVLFMSAALLEGGFGFEREQASAIVGIYAASVYLASLPGGWIADRLLGLRRAVLYGAALISAGHICIGLSAFAGGRLTFFLGLVLIVLGTGLLKPNISAIVGDLYPAGPEGDARRDAGFSIFYMGINVGGFAGQLVTGLLGEAVGWHWGFGAAGVGMLVGLAVFASRARATLGGSGARPSPLPDPAAQRSRERRAKLTLGAGLGVLALVFVLAASGVVTLDALVIGQYMTYALVGLAILYFGFLFAAGGLEGDERKRVLVIAVLFVFAAVFWSAFEQAPTSLNLFAKDFTDRDLGGLEVPAVWFQSVNSAFIILLAPVFAALWTWLGARRRDLSIPFKFSLGLLFTGLGFLLMIPAANLVAGSGGAVKVAAWWLVGSYFLQTIGELCLSPVGLSSMTKLSPRRYVGQMMGLWFLAAALGNLIAGLVGGHVDPEKLEQMPRLFTATTASLVISAVALGLLTIPIRRMIRHTEAGRAAGVDEKGAATSEELPVRSPLTTE
jgi:POT family proton-dependent oligopeptide transporter